MDGGKVLVDLDILYSGILCPCATFVYGSDDTSFVVFFHLLPVFLYLWACGLLAATVLEDFLFWYKFFNNGHSEIVKRHLSSGKLVVQPVCVHQIHLKDMNLKLLVQSYCFSTTWIISHHLVLSIIPLIYLLY